MLLLKPEKSTEMAGDSVMSLGSTLEQLGGAGRVVHGEESCLASLHS